MNEHRNEHRNEHGDERVEGQGDERGDEHVNRARQQARGERAPSRRRRRGRGMRTGMAATAAVLLAALTAAPAVAVGASATAPAVQGAIPAGHGPTVTSHSATPIVQGATPAVHSATVTSRGAARADHGRGTLVSVVPLGHVSRARIVEQAREAGFDGEAARHDVADYRLTYRTVTPEGRPTTASGLLVLPEGGARRLPTVVHAHGTLSYRGYAPSVADDSPDRAATQLFASLGRVGVAPDYLGLGTGPGRHLYMDAWSSSAASLDVLRAARSAVRALGRSMDGRVGVTGFSQGGQVAMALSRELAGGVDPRFRLRALAPVSGPYDLEGSTLPGMFDGRVAPDAAVYYVSYYLTAQNRRYPLYKDPHDVFRAPYADRVETLFDGEHPAEDVEGKLPGSLKELLTDTWHEKLRHPSGLFRKVIRASGGTCDWAPEPDVPTTLYTATGDTHVPVANTRACVRSLAKYGARATVIDQGAKTGHFGTWQRSVPDIARSLPAG
ncbi:alpha/beta hydrolase [Streptomyces sp. NPDC003077]|uniref:alpha/beta hydrolase family protein n=1 Tax=Streptomyces sp. NPDC003077 TaxID=3154443 RepID=UPI0033A979AD